MGLWGERGTAFVKAESRSHEQPAETSLIWQFFKSGSKVQMFLKRASDNQLRIRDTKSSVERVSGHKEKRKISNFVKSSLYANSSKKREAKVS